MPRRRLHGETQKRRQKKRTRVLKLSESATRVQATQRPMAYEASPELDGQDMEFLEAMRDGGVRRMPGAGGLPPRQQAIQRAQFAAEEQNTGDFSAAMNALGVTPLGSDPPRKPRKSRASNVEFEEPQAEEEREPSPPPPLPPKPARSVSTLTKPRAATRFETSAEDAALMEQALRDGIAGLNAKFQGAPAPKSPRSQPRERRSVDAEPDQELDLHGATQEQAIQRVQGFLLTAHRQKLRNVLIITGRGLGSGEQGPVLRTAVQRWLERNGGPYVRDFHAAPPRHGGEGAIWVVLK